MLAVLVALLLSACEASIPDDLARTVLLEEIGQLDGVRAGFVPCLSVDSMDVDASTLEAVRKVYPDVVPGSECQWLKSGSVHKASGRKAMLVNVFGYKRSGEIEFEARHHMKWATMKTLQVRRESSGWRIVATLKFMMAHVEHDNAADARNARV
jgi:hypothetical protein